MDFSRRYNWVVNRVNAEEGPDDRWDDEQMKWYESLIKEKRETEEKSGIKCVFELVELE